MTHTYKITGITCGGCEAKVKSSLLMLPNIIEVAISNDNETVTISMIKHTSIESLHQTIIATK